MKDDPRDHWLDVRGLKIHFIEWGDRDGQIPLILIHGFLDHARSWGPFVEALQKNAARPPWVIAPNCRGHGDSGWVGAGGYYHFPDYVFDLDCLIKALDVPEVCLMGHSMGGSISFLYAGTFPKRVRKLILVEGIGSAGLNFSDAPPRMEKWITEMRALEETQRTSYPSLKEAAARLQRSDPWLKDEMALYLAEHGTRPAADGTRIWKFDPLHRTTSPQPSYLGQALEFFRRIECPVLVIRGKESRHQSRPDLQERQAAIAHKTVKEIPNAGHRIHHDNPEALARAVSEFLEHSARGIEEV